MDYKDLLCDHRSQSLDCSDHASTPTPPTVAKRQQLMSDMIKTDYISNVQPLDLHANSETLLSPLTVDPITPTADEAPSLLTMDDRRLNGDHNTSNDGLVSLSFSTSSFLPSGLTNLSSLRTGHQSITTSQMVDKNSFLITQSNSTKIGLNTHNNLINESRLLSEDQVSKDCDTSKCFFKIIF